MSKILLVDDDDDMVKISSRWLEKAGYEVTTANSGKDALSLLAGVKPDLVILDYAMPEMTGPEVFEAIKADPAYKNTPVLFRTGVNDASAAEIEEKLHPEGIVLKSEGKPVLLEAISRIL